MNKCPKCGSPYPDAANFCPECGTDLRAAKAEAASITPDSITDSPTAPDLQTPADAVDAMNEPTTLDPDTPDASAYGAVAPAEGEEPIVTSDSSTPDSITDDAGAPDIRTPADAVDQLDDPETLDPDTPDASVNGAAAPVEDPADAYDPFPTRETVDRSTFPVSEERAEDAWRGDETPNYASESSWDQTDAEYAPDAAPGTEYASRPPEAPEPPGAPQVPVQGMEQTILENNDRYSQFTNHNYIGLVGFIISIVAACTSWGWGFGWFVWLVGAVVSFVGVFFQPRGFAIAGLVISLVGLIILIAACSMLLGAAAIVYASY